MNRAHLRMIRACGLNLAHDRLVSVQRNIGGNIHYSTGGESRTRCPEHDDALRRSLGATCLDSFWSQRYLSSLNPFDLLRLWWGWRKAARR